MSRHRFATAERFAPPVPSAGDEPGGAVCPQPVSRLDAVTGPPTDTWPQSEDCLWLSVAAAESGERQRPVVVFLHGGGFGTGSGLFGWYDGSRLAAEHDVVVISASYRLGPFGFLVCDGVSDGNLGLLDQLAALRWTQRHVAAFGGDPDNVTVVGQSAGAISIDAMLEAPERLFRRAILQSGPLELTRRSRADADEDGARFVANLGADPRTASPEAMLAAFAATAAERVERTGNRVDPPFAIARGAGPLGDDVATPRLDGLDVVLGWNADELTAFGFAAAESTTLTERWFAAPNRARAGQLAGLGAAVSSYRCDWRPGAFGATHCVELPLLLGDERAWRAAPMLGDTPWPEVDSLGRRWRAAWAGFARDGSRQGPLSGPLSGSLSPAP